MNILILFYLFGVIGLTIGMTISFKHGKQAFLLQKKEKQTEEDKTNILTLRKKGKKGLYIIGAALVIIFLSLSLNSFV